MMPRSAYMVIASDGDTERCEGLCELLGEALNRARTVVDSGLARHAWVATVIPNTQDYAGPGNLTP